MGLGSLFESILNVPGNIVNGVSNLFSSPSTETTVSSAYNIDQQALLAKLLGLANQGISSSAPSYPGTNYTPMQPLEQQYLDYASGAGGRANATNSALSNL